jgi:hypothetical protein
LRQRRCAAVGQIPDGRIGGIADHQRDASPVVPLPARRHSAGDVEVI